MTYGVVEGVLSKLHPVINEHAKRVGLGTFQSELDYINGGYGIITGAINVLPSDSLLALCNGNATLLEPHYKMIEYNLTTVPDELKMLQSIEATADVGSHTFFACYYSIFAVVDP